MGPGGRAGRDHTPYEHQRGLSVRLPNWRPCAFSDAPDVQYCTTQKKRAASFRQRLPKLDPLARGLPHILQNRSRFADAERKAFVVHRLKKSLHVHLIADRPVGCIRDSLDCFNAYRQCQRHNIAVAPRNPAARVVALLIRQCLSHCALSFVTAAAEAGQFSPTRFEDSLDPR